MATISVQWMVIELIGNVLAIYCRLKYETSTEKILPSVPGRILPPWPRTSKRTFFGHGDPIFLFFLRLRPHSQLFSRSTIPWTLAIRSTVVVYLSLVPQDLTTVSIFLDPTPHDVPPFDVQKTVQLLCLCFPITWPNRRNRCICLSGTVRSVQPYYMRQTHNVISWDTIGITGE